jgi:hypothetical protein
MGLDCFIRKLSKAKVLATYSEMAEHLSPKWGDLVYPDKLINVTVGQPLTLVKDYWRCTNDIAYWRGWRGLNALMHDVARDKLPEGDIRLAGVCLSGSPILLSEGDIERIRLEMVFGDIWSEYGFNFANPEKKFNEIIKDLDKAKRIIRRNGSLVFYIGSW